MLKLSKNSLAAEYDLHKAPPPTTAAAEAGRSGWGRGPAPTEMPVDGTGDGAGQFGAMLR